MNLDQRKIYIMLVSCRLFAVISLLVSLIQSIATSTSVWSMSWCPRLERQSHIVQMQFHYSPEKCKEKLLADGGDSVSADGRLRKIICRR
jgi:hypothetical protein